MTTKTGAELVQFAAARGATMGNGLYRTVAAEYGNVAAHRALRAAVDAAQVPTVAEFQQNRDGITAFSAGFHAPITLEQVLARSSAPEILKSALRTMATTAQDAFSYLDRSPSHRWIKS